MESDGMSTPEVFGKYYDKIESNGNIIPGSPYSPRKRARSSSDSVQRIGMSCADIAEGASAKRCSSRFATTVYKDTPGNEGKGVFRMPAEWSLHDQTWMGFPSRRDN